MCVCVRVYGKHQQNTHVFIVSFRFMSICNVFIQVNFSAVGFCGLLVSTNENEQHRKISDLPNSYISSNALNEETEKCLSSIILVTDCTSKSSGTIPVNFIHTQQKNVHTRNRN